MCRTRDVDAVEAVCIARRLQEDHLEQRAHAAEGSGLTACPCAGRLRLLVTSEIISPGMPLTCRWERNVARLRAAVALSAALSTACVSVAKQDHPQQIRVNGKDNNW